MYPSEVNTVQELLHEADEMLLAIDSEYARHMNLVAYTTLKSLIDFADHTGVLHRLEVTECIIILKSHINPLSR